MDFDYQPLSAEELQVRSLAKYLKISMRTARNKLAHPPFWLQRIYVMHQELTSEQRQRVEDRLAQLPPTKQRGFIKIKGTK